MRDSQKFIENFNSKINQADTVTLRHNETSYKRKTEPMYRSIEKLEKAEEILKKVESVEKNTRNT